MPAVSAHVGSLVAACELLVEACGFKFHDQGSNPGPLDWEHGVPATGTPGWWSLKWWKIFLKYCDIWKLCGIQFSVSIIKVLPSHSHAHLFLYHLWLLWDCSHHNRHHRSWRAENGYSQVLYGVSLSAPLLESCCSQGVLWTAASAPPGCLLEL